MATESVDIKVEDSGASPIGDVVVQVFDKELSAILAAGRTNLSTGILNVSLEGSDTYKVILAKSLTQFANPYDITVTDEGGSGTQTKTLVGTPLTITVPVAPALCRVFGYLFTQSGQVNDSLAILVEGAGTGRRSYVAGTGGIGAEPIGVAILSKTIRPNKVTGIWEIDLVQGALARVRIEAQSVDHVFRVPVETSVNFADIKPSPMGAFIGSAMGAASPFETPGP